MGDEVALGPSSGAARIVKGAAVVVALALIAALGWRLNLFGVRTEPPFGSVAAAFDATPAYPGYAWTRDGRSVSEFELVTIAGPGHCGWGAATFMFIGWPPRTVAPNSSQARQYIRDPHGVIEGVPREPFERDVKLPGDARATGHRLGAIEIYVSPSDSERWIYLVGPSDAERWPRSDPMTLCA
jgi:hypothetical protein